MVQDQFPVRGYNKARAYCACSRCGWELFGHFSLLCHFSSFSLSLGAPVAQWVKRWPTDLADRVRSSLEVKSSQP